MSPELDARGDGELPISVHHAPAGETEAGIQ